MSSAEKALSSIQLMNSSPSKSLQSSALPILKPVFVFRFVGNTESAEKIVRRLFVLNQYHIKYIFFVNLPGGIMLSGLTSWVMIVTPLSKYFEIDCIPNRKM